MLLSKGNPQKKFRDLKLVDSYFPECSGIIKVGYGVKLADTAKMYNIIINVSLKLPLGRK